MTPTSDPPLGELPLGDLPLGGHVCWVVDDAASYVELAAGVLADGRAAGEKTVAFGPGAAQSLRELARDAEMAADPRTAFLDGGPLDPDAMFRMFREQSARARAEGYRGIRLVADMDWLLPAHPTSEAVVGFELLLDRLVTELGATVVCAYRRTSFDAGAVTGVLSVHPIGVGADPPFRLVAADAETWRLSGEVDLAGAAAFATALGTAARHHPCVVDVGGLDFVDVAGMRVVARASRTGNTPIRLRGASARLRRYWRVAGFDELAPLVQLA